MSFTILLVDDDAVLVALMKRKLMLAGFQVETAPHGVLAIHMAQKVKPHLIVLDMQLPGGGGQAVMERLKRSTITQHVPVVILTAFESVSLEQTMIDYGAAAYIQKPIELDHLVEEAHRLLQRNCERLRACHTGVRRKRPAQRPRRVILSGSPLSFYLTTSRNRSR